MEIGLVTLVVRDYDEAIAWFTQKLGFAVVEDRALSPEKRWVVVSTERGASLLLARAASDAQEAAIGMQTGGRVGFFLSTREFDRHNALFRERGVEFEEEPRAEEYGRVAVFKDLYGNRWDLLEDRS
jgi:catechol 2,3-dioxygenase-like lactoylglutathione lyase family enzyme